MSDLAKMMSLVQRFNGVDLSQVTRCVAITWIKSQCAALTSIQTDAVISQVRGIPADKPMSANLYPHQRRLLAAVSSRSTAVFPL